ECRRPPCRARGALRREPCRGRPPGGGRAGTGARSADGRRRDRRLRGQAHGRRDRHLRARQPRQGGRRAGRPERQPPLRPGRDGRPPAVRGARRMSVTAASAFVAAGVHAGIRRSGLDLAIVRSTTPAVGAAVWTTNRVLAAPVVVSKRHLETAEPQAVVVNAGVANAATGPLGLADAERTAAGAAAALALRPEQILVLSTGVIGVPLPIDRVLAGVREASVSLGAEGGERAATAILTTDRGPKQAQVAGDGFV